VTRPGPGLKFWKASSASDAALNRVAPHHDVLLQEERHTGRDTGQGGGKQVGSNPCKERKGCPLRRCGTQSHWPRTTMSSCKKRGRIPGKGGRRQLKSTPRRREGVTCL